MVTMNTLQLTQKIICCFAFLLFVTVLCTAKAEAKLVVSFDSASDIKAYAVNQLAAVAGEVGRVPLNKRKRADLVILSRADRYFDLKLLEVVEKASISAEGFSIKRVGNALYVIGADDRGAMYGVLDIARQIDLGTPFERIDEQTINPQFPVRAIKLNLPYMSYRVGESLQSNYETMRKLKFWRDYLDMMAKNRFNTLTLWSLHPFHYLIKPTNFPEASPWSETEMRQWQALWSAVFQMAKQRGIETYLINWNIFVSPQFARAHQIAEYSEHWQHYGNGDNSALVEKYTREVVTQVIDEYPDLTGLGITLGERMGGMDADERRTWLDRTFFAGIKKAGRPIKFLYRAPLSANKSSGGSTSEENDRKTRRQIESLENIIEPVYISFKYNWSHGHSATDLFIVHGGKLSDAYWNPLPENYQVLWTIRNEDFHILRWAQPDFIRAHIQTAGKPYVGGYIIGSEVNIPANDYMTRPGSHKNWDWSFQRQWLFYSCWGNLLYNANTSDTLFESMLNRRFPEVNGKELLQAWKLASQTPLRFASFYRGQNDLSLYTEGHVSWGERRSPSFISVDRLINRPVLDKRYINIHDFVHGGEKIADNQISPLALADTLVKDARRSMLIVDKMRRAGIKDATLDAELSDIESWYWLAKYIAEQIRGGVYLERYRVHGQSEDKVLALRHLRNSTGNWLELSHTIRRFNHEQLPFYAGVPFSWMKYLSAAEEDVQTAKNAKPYKD